MRTNLLILNQYSYRGRLAQRETIRFITNFRLQTVVQNLPQIKSFSSASNLRSRRHLANMFDIEALK